MKIIIIGAGRVGLHLGKILSAENNDVVLIEKNPAAVKKANDALDALVIEGNGSSPDMLARAGIEHADILIAVSGNDEINIVACMLANKVGVGKKIARVRNTEFSKTGSIISKEELGIDFIIHPEEETARELVLLIRRAVATDIVEFADGKAQLVGIRVDKNASIMNKTLEQINQEYPDILFRIVAIFRNNKTIIPTGRDYVNRGDQLFFITQTKSIPQIMEIAGKSQEKMENLMILGGGKVGRKIAMELEKVKQVNIKLIESSREKSEKIANHVSKTLIILGDGTDIDLLATEGIMDMDGFVSVTNDEETNIISCLLAKHLGVKRAMALVNRSDYMPIMGSIGLDAVVDQQMITANSILRFIKRGNIISIAQLRGIEAEVFEITVEEKSKIINKTLKKFKIPEHALIGLILRNGDVIVPTGDTEILAQDRLFVFALPDAIYNVQKVFG